MTKIYCDQCGTEIKDRVDKFCVLIRGRGEGEIERDLCRKCAREVTFQTSKTSFHEPK